MCGRKARTLSRALSICFPLVLDSGSQCTDAGTVRRNGHPCAALQCDEYLRWYMEWFVWWWRACTAWMSANQLQIHVPKICLFLCVTQWSGHKPERAKAGGSCAQRPFIGMYKPHPMRHTPLPPHRFLTLSHFASHYLQLFCGRKRVLTARSEFCSVSRF